MMLAGVMAERAILSYSTSCDPVNVFGRPAQTVWLAAKWNSERSAESGNSPSEGCAGR